MYFYDVEDFGAKGDGKTLDTDAIQGAIDACGSAGGGKVVCGPGLFLSGSLTLRDNVELHLSAGCEIRGTAEIADYKEMVSEGFFDERSPEGTSHYLIGASHCANIAVTGAGIINASGPEFFDKTKLRPGGTKFAEKPKRRPRLLMFHKCSNVRLEDVSFVDSPCWTIWLMMCDNVSVRGIKIDGDQRMINNDGIDVDSCQNVTISDCRIKTDDDSIVLRAMQNLYDEPAICENVAITNCVLESTCQCVRVSCPSDHIVCSCLLDNIVMKSRNNGINFDFPHRYASDSGVKPVVEDVCFSNLVIECEGHFIRIEAEEGIELGRIAGITFSNIRARSGKACVVKGNSDSIIEDVVFDNVRIDVAEGPAFDFERCRGIKMNGVEATVGC